ncbi:putative antigenic cell wall galactomannoprotein [Phyllosticta citricarpa]|uniref:Antigenic cell wall galactomannoprotein n=2 Tax=Phyllosticta TaxID=121621 RepID=A0ABR1L6N9_9PEZI
MKFTYFVPALLATAIATPIVEKRDATEAITAINKISTQLDTFNQTLTQFATGQSSGLGGALDLQSGSGDVETVLQEATTTVQNAQPFNEQDSAQVAQAILAFQPKIFATIDGITAVKPQLEASIGSLTSVVKTSLQEQQTAAQGLADAVSEKLTGEFKAQAPVINKQIQDRFNSAIQAYSA